MTDTKRDWEWWSVCLGVGLAIVVLSFLAGIVLTIMAGFRDGLGAGLLSLLAWVTLGLFAAGAIGYINDHDREERERKSDLREMRGDE